MREDELAYAKIQAMNQMIRTCKSKSEVDELLQLVPKMGEYVRLPNERS